jgi:hypothetical protein
MSDRKREILITAENMDFYGEANPQLATELPVTVELFAENKTNIGRLRAAGVTRDSSDSAGKSGTRSKVARADEIAADCRRVRKTARILEKKVPDFINTFDFRRGDYSYVELIDRATAIIDDAVRYSIHFAKYGLTDAFFTTLSNNVNGLRQATQEQSDAKRTSVGAVADTEAILEDTLDVRAQLKIAIENHYRNNPAKLAEWLSASHIRRRGETTPNPPPTT